MLAISCEGIEGTALEVGRMLIVKVQMGEGLLNVHTRETPILSIS